MCIFINILYNIKNFLYYVISAIFYLLPLKKNKLVVDNFLGKGYGDNPKYIVQKILEEQLDYDVVWLMADKNKELPAGVRCVKYGSLASLYEYITAKYWIDNVRNSYKPLYKRKRQVYIQTWHGSISCKWIEKDAEDMLDSKYVKAAKRDGKWMNAIIADSRMMAQLYKRSFWLNPSVEILQYGSLRADFLMQYNRNYDLVNAIRERLKFTENDYVVLYAPTFRDYDYENCYDINFQKMINLFEIKYKKNCKILVKLHPNAISKRDLFVFGDNVIDVCDYNDTQKLALVSDCLITDYSSVFMDFIALNKMVYLYTPDIDKYQKERGLYYDFFELPFAIASNQEQLFSDIMQQKEADYHTRVKEYCEKNQITADGHVASRIVDWIKHN